MTQQAIASTTLPSREEVAPGDRWDLSPLYSSVDAWESDFAALEAGVPQLAAFRGTLDQGPERLREFFDLDTEQDLLVSRLYHYAQRRSDEDTSNGQNRGRVERIASLWSRVSEALAFFRSELFALPDEKLQSYLDAEVLAPYRFNLEVLLRSKPYTLSEREERLLAMASEITRAPSNIFGQLNDADLTFGTIEDSEGNTIELTHGSYGVFLSKPDRPTRKRFFEQFYAAYEAHKNTFAATLAAGVKKNIFTARARGFESARHAALFNVELPESVYDSLLEAVDEGLPTLHRYYDLRKRLLGVDELHFYDQYVPLVSEMQVEHSYDEAVETVVASLEPLGTDYTTTLHAGLRKGWVDRYENRGKRSGAYSASSYGTHPYILMNYQAEDLNHVYTLTHEAGHAMHSWYSNENQPPQYSHYTIFVAEVASTFNEVLLTQHLLNQTNDARMRAYILNREIDNIRGTLFRQAMFAEFEHRLHQHAEANKPLSLDEITGLYHGILERHFGPRFTLDPQLDIECLRIPHFYYNFYVFQYATGISAAYALANRVLGGEEGALDDYKGFLSAGGSKYPIEILAGAGVDMTEPAPVKATLAHFAKRLDELENLLG